MKKFLNIQPFTFSIIITAFAVCGLLATFAVLISGFEAHVINVTATIDQRMCDALSMGYWKNHEGCSHGEGESIWAPEVNELSALFGGGGAFATSTGQEMCVILWISNCPGGNTVAAALCKAKAHALSLELNIVSGHLDKNAFLAGADDGSPAFDNLFLNPFSTILEALTAIESILGDNSATKQQLKDAAHVAERIIAFYENENPFWPQCVDDPEDVPICINRPVKINVENNNNAEVENTVDVYVDTGGNSADGGGDVETGNATSTVIIENEVNINELTVECCPTCCPPKRAERPCRDRGTTTPCVHGDEDEEEETTTTPEVILDTISNTAALVFIEGDTTTTSETDTSANEDEVTPEAIEEEPAPEGGEVEENPPAEMTDTSTPQGGEETPPPSG